MEQIELSRRRAHQGDRKLSTTKREGTLWPERGRGGRRKGIASFLNKGASKIQSRGRERELGYEMGMDVETEGREGGWELGRERTATRFGFQREESLRRNASLKQRKFSLGSFTKKQCVRKGIINHESLRNLPKKAMKQSETNRPSSSRRISISTPSSTYHSPSSAFHSPPSTPSSPQSAA